MSLSNMSPEMNEKFVEHVHSLRKLQEVLLREQNGAYSAVFDAIRVHMVCAAAALSRSGMHMNDEELKDALHSILDMGIADFQYNERLHIGSKEGS